MKRSTAGAFAFYQKRSIAFSGGHREDVTPVPIPNTEVKSLIGEGTARFAGGRVARCRVFPQPDLIRGQAFFVCLLGLTGLRSSGFPSPSCSGAYIRMQGSLWISGLSGFAAGLHVDFHEAQTVLEP